MRGWSVGKDLETFIGRIEIRELCLLDKEERRRPGIFGEEVSAFIAIRCQNS